MSYRGRPSKGCEGCRARKVKCNEAKPTCNRCSKSGQECRYRDQADLLFRNQTAVAAQRAEESWRKRSKSHQRARSKSNSARSDVVPQQEMLPLPINDNPYPIPGPSNASVQETSSSSKGKERAAAVSPVQQLSIAPTIAPNLWQLAYERFVYDFVVPERPNRSPEEPSDALFIFVPMLHQHAAPDSCLSTIVQAVAYINFANRCQAPTTTLAEESFGKAIQMLSSVISNKEQAASNDALCSVYLMGVYENLTSVQRRGTFAAHQAGANALLQLRQVEQYNDNPVATKLYDVAFAQMIIASLQTAKPPAIPIESFLAVKNNLKDMYSQAHASIIHLMWQEAKLHAQWCDMKQNARLPTSRHNLQEILQSALDLNSEFESRENTLPPTYKPGRAPNTPEGRSAYEPMWQKLVLESRGAPEEIQTFTSLKRYHIWAIFRTSRMFLLRDIIEIINWMFRLPEPEFDLSSQQLRIDSAQHIASSDQGASQSKAVSLDILTLHNLYSHHAACMGDYIEQGCATVLGCLTVPIHKKSLTEVMSVRGYLLLWTCGVMDAILHSGHVPDSNRSIRLPVTSSSSPNVSPCMQTAHPIPHSLKFSGPLNAAMASGEAGSSRRSSSIGRSMHRYSFSQPNTPAQSPPRSASVSDKSGRRVHAFDSLSITSRHANDEAFDSPRLDFNIPQPKTIDVAAKRFWINSMLYYIGTRLGIRKALAVPIIEGYMNTVKPAVEDILAQ